MKCFFSLIFYTILNLFAGDSPKIAHSFELNDIDGNTISLSDILVQNKPIIFSFFSTKCSICLKEIRELPEIIKEYDPIVYLINVDDNCKKAGKFLDKNNITFPVLCDPKAKVLGNKYDLFRGAFIMTPKTVLLSPSGTIEFVSESYDDEKKNLLKNALAEVSKKKWDKYSEIAIFFTNSINGYLESCNCYKHPYGGFIKFYSWLKEERKHYPYNILVDSGDFLPHSVSDNSASLIIKAFELAKYDAVSLGDQDIYYPKISLIGNKKIPFIASNLKLCDLNCQSCNQIGSPYKILTVNGIKIKIISFINPDTFFLYTENFVNRLKISGMKDILAKGDDTNFLILLSHSGFDYDKRLPDEFDGIDLIVGGHSQTLLSDIVRVKQTLIVQAGSNLQNAGRLILKFDKNKKLVSYDYDVIPLTNNIPDAPEIKKLIDEEK
jgi:peroxiredoxin